MKGLWRQRRPTTYLLMLSALLAASACTGQDGGVLDDIEATSCASFFGGVAPGAPEIVEPGVTVWVGAGPGRLTACFYRDKERAEEARAITWESLDPTIATVSPSTGPETLVTGLRLGVTRVRAVITGVEAFAGVVVCEANTCP